MEKSKNRNHIKPIIPDDTETMYKLQNKSAFTGYMSFSNSDCLAFKI